MEMTIEGGLSSLHEHSQLQFYVFG